MAKDKFSIFSVAKNLACACFISGIVIATTYYFTAPVAAKKQVQLKNDSMKELIKNADDFKPVSGKTDWYSAQKGSKTIGYIVPSESKGYGGKITLLVAVSQDGKVIDFSVVSHNETPGLGANASEPSFKDQFAGKSSNNLKVTKDKSDKDDIQAMTGATITSRAVTKGVKAAVDEVNKYVGGK
ncbi:RnfABCDGE type electron transport complex subunit G [Clostridium sp. cel8]|uniref:RnfABCDGE type electron transport complex subunit G n=1 Tax=unclassified Clostridium TaxID=2614128 RepID=UPI0015F5C177|nr:RnfABCDGE type electron transport complex subunit G [Clostridium sp. cel8]MBA5850299.1 RnfABCDGE type electron transport complex subunit G [Clostridium sp. cel8]